MAVTLPSAAGLGASGACVVHNSKTRAGEVFAFPPIAAPGPINGVSFMVPTGVRAVTLMHIRHGQARWEFDVAPAERMARARRPGVARPVARSAGRRRVAGRRSRGAAHLRQGHRHRRHRRRQLGAGRSCRHAGLHSPARAASTSSRAPWRGCCRTRWRRWAAACRSKSLRNALPITGRAGRRELRRLSRLCRTGAARRRERLGRLARPARAGRRRADQLRRLLRLRGDRREGWCGGLRPVDGPTLRRAHDRARAPASCWAP